MARAVVALGALGIAVGVALALGGSHHTWLGTNGVAWAEFVQVVDGGHGVCQRAGPIPAGTGAVRMRIGNYDRPGPPLTLRVLAGGRELTRGTLRRGWPNGDIDVPVRTVAHGAAATRLCVHNAGPTRVAIAGEDRGSGPSRARRIGLVFYSGTAPSWWSQSGLLGKRFAQARSSWYGSASLVVALVLVLVAAGLAVLVAWRLP